MKYSFLAAALSLGLGTGAALADTSSTDTSQPAPAAETNVQPVELFFATDSSQLGDNASADLQKLATWARCNPKAAIILEGHADPTGAKDYNVKLSGARAAMVRQQLIGMGVPSDHIVVTVYGENGPLRATYAQDRRVTVRGVDRPIEAADLSTQLPATQG